MNVVFGQFSKISPSCYSTMMVELLNGMNLSGRRQLFMLVYGSKLNGESIRWHLQICSWLVHDNFRWTTNSEKQPIYLHSLNHVPRWYAKRFLHPNIVAAYDYIFMWDEDLGVEHFDAEEWVFVFWHPSLVIWIWLCTCIFRTLFLPLN